jgi:hypothetical protein
MNSAGDMTARCARRVLAVATFHVIAMVEAAKGRASCAAFWIATEWMVIRLPVGMFSLHHVGCSAVQASIQAATGWTCGDGVQGLNCFSSVTSLASSRLAPTA